jgi:hypothetical protein
MKNIETVLFDVYENKLIVQSKLEPIDGFLIIELFSIIDDKIRDYLPTELQFPVDWSIKRNTTFVAKDDSIVIIALPNDYLAKKVLAQIEHNIVAYIF